MPSRVFFGNPTAPAATPATGGKGKGGKKGGGTGSPPVPPGKLKAFGVGKWNLGNRRWF